jgi:hypothetical protein
MNPRSEFLRLAFVLALLLFVSSCSNQNILTSGQAQQDPTPTLFITSLGGNPYPLNNQGTPIIPSLTPIPPTETKDPAYPAPIPRPSFTLFPVPRCDEDYLRGAIGTPAPSDSYNRFPPMTYSEVGRASPEEIVKMLLGKHLEQFMNLPNKSMGLVEYAVRQISIDHMNQCRGPDQIENYLGYLVYSVKPVSTNYSNWLVGGAGESGDGWINFGTHFVLIKTTSTFELKLIGNG